MHEALSLLHKKWTPEHTRELITDLHDIEFEIKEQAGYRRNLAESQNMELTLEASIAQDLENTLDVPSTSSGLPRMAWRGLDRRVPVDMTSSSSNDPAPKRPRVQESELPVFLKKAYDLKVATKTITYRMELMSTNTIRVPKGLDVAFDFVHRGLLALAETAGLDVNIDTSVTLTADQSRASRFFSTMDVNDFSEVSADPKIQTAIQIITDIITELGYTSPITSGPSSIGSKYVQNEFVRALCREEELTTSQIDKLLRYNVSDDVVKAALQVLYPTMRGATDWIVVAVPLLCKHLILNKDVRNHLDTVLSGIIAPLPTLIEASYNKSRETRLSKAFRDRKAKNRILNPKKEDYIEVVVVHKAVIDITKGPVTVEEKTLIGQFNVELVKLSGHTAKADVSGLSPAALLRTANNIVTGLHHSTKKINDWLLTRKQTIYNKVKSNREAELENRYDEVTDVIRNADRLNPFTTAEWETATREIALNDPLNRALNDTFASANPALVDWSQFINKHVPAL
jgi:hypothetical protein